MKDNNKSSKSTKIIFIVFIVICLAAVAWSVKHILSSNNTQNIPFSSDGYVIKYNSGNNKQEVITFNSGVNYSYNKTEDVSFNKNVIPNDLIAHYQNGNVLVFKNIVGLDLLTIDKDIILYYNIFKNTTIEHKDDYYFIKAVGDKEVTFNKLLLRISENKYLLLTDTIRLTTSTNEIIEFNDYVYFEYLDGDIVSIYNDSKVYKTISSDAKLVSGDIIIDFSDKYIIKNDVKYITLSNLVIDMDSNIDIIPTEIIEKEAEIKNADKVDIPESSETNNTAGGTAGQTEETVEEKDVYKEPKFKITDLKVTTIDINATIEITDDDSLICSSTLLSIVENSTSKTIYTNEYMEGDLNLQLSYSGLNPDTEYTLYLRTNFKVDDVEYSKNFISKIFRTESLGISMTKGYAKIDSLEVDVLKESFSRVSECTVYISNENGVLLSSQTIEFDGENKQSVVFDGLTKNTNYAIKLTDIVSNNVLVADGYAIKQKMKTLKELPTIEELKFEINKANQQFNLSLGTVNDPDYGIKSYRYEIFDARQDMDAESPIMTFEKEDKGNVAVKVDDVKINRGVAYTYRLITTFYDNDKTIELVNTLGETMQLDGVKFPTVRFEETSVTWEQINGSLIVDDDGGTLVGKTLKVVYKNSLGTYTSKTLNIDVATNSVPININDLRANETYTFDVYASIDLQDGNGVSDLTYIGSVTVKTKTPQPLMASFNNYEDYENVFAINFMLINPDAELEAKTLSEMKFTIYEGANTLGSPVASRTVVDTNNDPYQSTLKQNFYDDYTTITPSFFGSNISNKDFTGKTYTMKVTSLYDYTSYKNEIPVTENTYSFTLNGILPSLPKDPDNAITVTPIPNRSAVTYGLEKNNDLDPATIIGYQIQADYVDTSETSIECDYQFYAKNKDTKEFDHIESLDKTVAIEDGSIVPKIVIPIGDGTNENVDTDMLRRGNVYYITYRIKMYYDTDGDEVKEYAYYPDVIQAGTTLRSKDMSIPKQSATIVFYPATSTANTSTWKYKIKDIDNTMVDKKINMHVNNSSSPTSSKEVLLGQDDFNDVTFTGVSKGNIMSFKYKEQKYRTAAATDVLLTNQYFYGINTFASMPISAEILNNRLIVKFDNYEANESYFNIVSSVDIKVNGGGQEVICKDKLIDSGYQGVSLNLYDIKDLLGEDLTITLIIHFDSGTTGFDVLEDEEVILQETTSGEAGLYYQLTDNLNIIPNNVINSTYTFKRLDTTESKLHLGGYSLGVTLNKQGLSYNYMGTLYGMVMKKVSSVDIVDTETVKFDYLIPQINMYKEDGSLNVTPLIDGVILSPQLGVTPKTTLVNNKIYLELYKTDSYGKNEEFINTYIYSVSDFNNPIDLIELENKTNYYARFYTYIEGYPQKFYLYDSESYDLGVKYHFSTLADVEITNFSAELGGSSYSGKKLTLSYELGVTEGFDYIDYEIYRYRSSSDTFVKVCNGPRSVNFKKGMSVIVNANPDSGIIYDARYKVKFKPVGSYEKDGETIVVDLAEREFEFNIGTPSKVTANISSSISSDSIIFKVAINNANYNIINDEYISYLRDQNGELVTSTYVSNCDANISPKRYEFKNLEEGKIYTFFVQIDVDYDNDGVKDETIYRNKSIKFGDSVSIGSVVASQGTEPNLIYLKYVDSYQISSIQSVSYTITCYKGEEYKYLYSNSSNFQVIYDSENNLYTQTISLGNREIQEDYTYFIEINYSVGNEVVAEASLTYIGAALYE